MKRLSLTALLGGALLLAACATAPADKLVNYRGGDLRGVITVQRAATDLAESGLPQAKVILANTAGTTQKFEYKFVWYDKNDMPLDDNDRPWHAASISGRDEMSVTGTAPGDKATRFQIQIRSPQGVTQ